MLIVLTKRNTGDEKLLINTDSIDYIESGNSFRGATVYYAHGLGCEVRETLDEILSSINREKGKLNRAW